MTRLRTSAALMGITDGDVTRALLRIAGQRLGALLNQPLRDEPSAAARIQPLPRLGIDQVSAQRFAVPLLCREILCLGS